MTNLEQRAFTRIQFEALLQHKMPEVNAITFTHLYNFCQGGVYFVSHLPMVPNDETTIVIPVVLGESLVTGAYDTYRVRICWCKKIKKQTLKYGMGVQFLAKIEGLMKDADLADHYSQCDLCDLCDQRLEGEGVYYFNDMVYLCLPCYEHLKRYPTGILRESIISFIYRNSV